MPHFRDAFQAAQEAWFHVSGDLTRQELEAHLRSQIDPETGEPFATQEEILSLLQPWSASELEDVEALRPSAALGPESRSPPVSLWQGPSREVRRNQPMVSAKAPPPNPPSRDWNHASHQSDEPGFSLLPWYSNYWLGVPPAKSFKTWNADFIEAHNKFTVVLHSGPSEVTLEDVHKARTGMYESFAAVCGAKPYSLDSEDAAEDSAAQTAIHRWLRIAQTFTASKPATLLHLKWQGSKFFQG